MCKNISDIEYLSVSEWLSREGTDPRPPRQSQTSENEASLVIRQQNESAPLLKLRQFFCEYRGDTIDHTDFHLRFWRLDSTFCQLALLNGEIIGALGAYFVDDAKEHAWTCNFFVLEEHRGRGVGRELCSRVWKALGLAPNQTPNSKGTQTAAPVLRAVGLNTDFDNPMLEFYERNGFRFRSDLNTGKQSSWDTYIITGYPSASQMTEAEEWLAGRYGDELYSHEVKRVNALSAEMLAYDACVTGLQRTRFLAHMMDGAFEVLESRASDTGKLTGFSVVLANDRVFWVFLTLCDTPAVGFKLLFTHLFTYSGSSSSSSVPNGTPPSSSSEHPAVPFVWKDGVSSRRVLVGGPRSVMDGASDLRGYLMARLGFKTSVPCPPLILNVDPVSSHEEKQQSFASNDNSRSLHAMWSPLTSPNPPEQLFISPLVYIAPF